MFYSHTFLARKGPLGTVWCAAHLQHKLKRSHYTSTNVFSTADRIMHPEVPIALRMYGHLLLGIVRIYSKQVDYLYQDCNGALTLLTKTFTSLKVTEPVDFDSDQASSLPKRFKLDEVRVDENSQRAEDDNPHVKSPEDITLPDHPFATAIHNVVTNVTEVNMTDSSAHENASEFQPMPMDQDTVPLVSEENAENREDYLNNNQAEIDVEIAREKYPISLPEVEIMRDPDHEVHREPVAVFDGLRDVRIEPDGLLEEQFRKDVSRSPPSMLHDQHEMPSAASDDFVLRSLHGDGTPELAIRSTPPAPVLKSPELVLRDTPIEIESIEIVLQPTPPVIAQQRVQQRKRKIQLYDEATVLTNRVMKHSLEDTSNLLRKKRLRRSDNLGLWKLQNKLKKDAVFFEPVISGLSTDLDIVFNSKIYSKPRLISSSNEDPIGVLESPIAAINNNDDMEIELLRNNIEDPNFNNHPMSELSSMPSPKQNRCDSDMTTMPSTSRRDIIYTPSTMDMDFTSNSDRLGATNATEFVTTPEMTAESTAFQNSGPETSTTHLREGRFGQYTPLSNIPESAAADSPRYLDFLEKDNSPIGTPASIKVGEKEVPQFDSLPATTRAVGQYFKRRSSGTPNSECSSETIKLGSILENKTKKICSRMFFETLVLKSYGFVDVEQEEAYSDIKLKVTSKLKEQCSG